MLGYETYIAFVRGWSRSGHCIKLSITQVVNSFSLGQLTKQNSTFLFRVVGGSRWYLLWKLGCIVGESCALRSDSEHKLGSLPRQGLMVVRGSGDVTCWSGHVIEKVRVLILWDSVFRLWIQGASLCNDIALDSKLLMALSSLNNYWCLFLLLHAWSSTGWSCIHGFHIGRASRFHV